MKTIELIISPQGEARLESRGFSGPACREATAFLEQALGPTTSERITGEFHQSQPQREAIHESR